MFSINFVNNQTLKVLSVLYCTLVLSGCVVGDYTSKGLGKTLDFIDGPNGENMSDRKICVFATDFKNGYRTWRKNAGFEERIKNGGLSCGVGQPEFFSNGEFYKNNDKIYLSGLSDKTICDVIKLASKQKIAPVETHVTEAERRRLICSNLVINIAKNSSQIEHSTKKIDNESAQIALSTDDWILRMRSYVYD
jgi:hypothetical protein